MKTKKSVKRGLRMVLMAVLVLFLTSFVLLFVFFFTFESPGRIKEQRLSENLYITTLSSRGSAALNTIYTFDAENYEKWQKIQEESEWWAYMPSEEWSADASMRFYNTNKEKSQRDAVKDVIEMIDVIEVPECGRIWFRAKHKSGLKWENPLCTKILYQKWPQKPHGFQVSGSGEVIWDEK